MKIKTTLDNVKNIMLSLNFITKIMAEKEIVIPSLEYAINRNIAFLEDEVKIIKNCEKSLFTKEVFEYEKLRTEICERFTQKDADDKPMVATGANNQSEYVIIPEKQEEFNAEIAALQEKNKESLENHQKNFENYANMLKDEVEVDVYKIPLSRLESLGSSLKTGTIKALMELIDDTK